MLDLKISTILVDSDQQRLKNYVSVLKQVNELSIVGTAKTGEQGLALSRTCLPQLIFVNVVLLDMSGLNFAQTIRNRNQSSEIIFLSANKQLAYESLSIEPIDYFVLPLEEDLISKMIGRLKHKFKRNELCRKMDIFSQTQQITVKRIFFQKKGITVLPLDEIMYCKAELTKTTLKLRNGENVLVKTSIGATMEIINHENFVRIARSYFINKNYLRKIDKKSFKCILYYKGQTWEVPVSKSAIGMLEKLNVQPIY